jgi:hypothetical protein
VNHGTRADAALCFDGPDGARCPACDATGNMTGADRARRKRARARATRGPGGPPAVTPAVAPAPHVDHAHGSRSPARPRDASQGPRDGSAGPAATPGGQRGAQARTGPGGATGRGHGAATATGPRWAIPDGGPPGLRADLAAYLATVAAGDGEATLTTHQADGQTGREYRQELKDVAAFLREFRAGNTDIYFHYQGLTRADGYPMKGLSYSAWYVTFIPDESPAQEYMPPSEPRENASRPTVVSGMGPETQAQFNRDRQKARDRAAQLEAARREASQQARIVSNRQNRDCDSNIHGPRITDPVSGRVECGWCQTVLFHGYPPDRAIPESTWGE